MNEVIQGSKNTWVQSVDEPGAGGAHHEYGICSNIFNGNEALILGSISFQKGPIKETGINGVTHEDLLVIMIDRLTKFQEGLYKCKENDIALMDLQHCLETLRARTQKREERGVEGTSII